MRARDMVESAKNVVQVLWLRKLVVGRARQDNREAKAVAMASVGIDSVL
jgi:hypothetical protein